MSRVNGDKSRFNRERKQNIARRNKTRDLVKHLAAKGKSTTSASSSKQKTVSV
jgi:hypothetical protein